MQHAPEVHADDITLGSKGSPYFWASVALMVIGAAATFFAVSGSEHGKHEFFQSYLLNFTFVLTISLGAVFFLIITYLLRAGWSIGVRRIAEVLTVPLLPLAVLAVPIVFGMHELYEWTHAEEVAHDEILQGKVPYLNENFFIGRLIAYFVIWNLIGYFYRFCSKRQDDTGDPKYTSRMERYSAVFVLAYGLTVTLASFDLLMSLNPHWYSTIYGVYFFAGCFLGCLATIPLVTMLLHRVGKLRGVVNAEHFHDLGKLLFAFTVFWAYIAFSQYMLIWYSNLPEETVFYEIRMQGFWGPWSVLLLFGHFFLPFLLIMSRYQKRRPPVLAATAIWMLAMNWVDFYWLIMPGHRPTDAPFRLVDVTLLVAFVGFFFAVVFFRLGQVKLIPTGDPRMAESLSFENV